MAPRSSGRRWSIGPRGRGSSRRPDRRAARAPATRRRLHARSSSTWASTHLCPGCGEPIAMRSALEAIAELDVDPAHDRGVRHRLLHRVLQQPRRRGAPGAARPRAVARHRRQASRARHGRVHRAGRRRHGERGAAGGAARRRPRREHHLHHVEQRRVRRDRRPHDRHHRARPAHQEHARRSRRRSARLSDPAEQPDRRSSKARPTWRAAR